MIRILNFWVMMILSELIRFHWVLCYGTLLKKSRAMIDGTGHSMISHSSVSGNAHHFICSRFCEDHQTDDPPIYP